jgi:hypothetical protein
LRCVEEELPLAGDKTASEVALMAEWERKRSCSEYVDERNAVLCGSTMLSCLCSFYKVLRRKARRKVRN